MRFSTSALALHVLASASAAHPTDRLATFEDVFNAADASLDAFAAEHFADHDPEKPARIAGFLRELRGVLGPIDVVRLIDKADQSRFVAAHAIAHLEKTDEWKNFQFFIRPDADGRFDAVAISDAIEPRDVPPGGFADVSGWLSDHIDRLARERSLSGAFVVARGDAIVFRDHTGWQDHAAGIPVSDETVFNMASGSKMFTAVVIGQLVEAGELAFDQPLGDELAEHTGAPAHITVHQLLTHTSGLPEFWTDAFEKVWHDIESLTDVRPYFTDRPLEFEPGTDHRYCNTNYLVLGMVIEAVTGDRFADVVARRIFEPANMTASGYFALDDPDAPMATAYEVVIPGEAWIPAELGRRGGPAGGGYTSVDDLLRFVRALHDGTLVSAGTLNTLTTGKVAQTVGGEVAYGFIDADVEGQRAYGHGGLGPGSFFDVRIFPDTGTTVAYLANHGGTAAIDVFQKLREVAHRGR